MALLDNGEPEEFLLFISNFNLTLETSGMLLDRVNFQYLCTLVSGEALLQFDTLLYEVEITISENLKSIILGFGTYFFPVNAL